MSEEIFKNDIPMSEFVKMMESFDPKTIMEIGCLNAQDSMFFKEKFPSARVIAIEGLPENYEFFMKGMRSVEAHQMVMNSYDGEVTFFKKNTNGIHGIYDRGEIYGSEKLTLQCQRLDTFCLQHGIDCIDAVKIDVEGATIDVLNGFGDMLEKVKIMHIETEDYEFFKGQKLQPVVHEFLKSKNFTPVLIRGFEISNGNKQYDEVWVKNV